MSAQTPCPGSRRPNLWQRLRESESKESKEPLSAPSKRNGIYDFEGFDRIVKDLSRTVAFNEGLHILEDGSTSVTDSSREDLNDIAMGIDSPSTLSVISAPKETNNGDKKEAMTSVNNSISVASNDSGTTASTLGVAKDLFHAKAFIEEMNAMSAKEVTGAMCCLARVMEGKVELQDGRNLELEGSVNEERSLNSALKAKLEKSDKRNAFLEAKLKITTEQLKTSERDLAKATKEILQLKQDKDQAEVQVASRGAELVRLYSAHKSTTDRNLQLQNELGTTEVKLQNTTQLLGSTNTTAGALKVETQDLRKQLQEKDKLTKVQNSEIVGLITTVDGLQDEVDGVRYELQLSDDLRTAAEHQLAGVSEQVQLLRQENDRAQKEGALKEAELKEIRAERDALEELNGSYQGYISVIEQINGD